MFVLAVMRKELKTGKETLEGVFTSEEKAQKYIENTNESGDYVEYGITRTLLNKTEAKIDDELIESLQSDKEELAAWLERCKWLGEKLYEQEKEIKRLKAQLLYSYLKYEYKK